MKGMKQVFKLTKRIPEAAEQKNTVMALWNPAGGDSSELLEALLPLVRKAGESVAVVEYPCLGVPRIAYRFGLEDIPPAQTIDQLLIDYDRGMLQPFHSYLLPHEEVDCLLIQPRSKPDAPVLLKLQQENTLIDLPVFLKAQLSGYDWVFFILQGQLIHPMTFFGLRAADKVVLVAREPLEWIRAVGAYALMKEDYGFSTEQLLMFSESRHSLIREQGKKDFNLIAQPAELLKRKVLT
ncbi:hypothetical protein KIH86_08470 [Paenibacillus sp. HN-1]|uniref:hypothetical protein n=2 Tax=Paenibacillus TaxID=44249 RepID=UPI000FBD60D1|nr:hypothetical protein [Paenibacillus sp. CGMCC 1.18879]MBY9079584.1 hypothetical protein [Paenibacillus sp. CGMCC 1.18879]MBY9084273.1 hypothetical protein [Paenibacillus sinensis]